MEKANHSSEWLQRTYLCDVLPRLDMLVFAKNTLVYPHIGVAIVLASFMESTEVDSNMVAIPPKSIWANPEGCFQPIRSADSYAPSVDLDCWAEAIARCS